MSFFVLPTASCISSSLSAIDQRIAEEDQSNIQMIQGQPQEAPSPTDASAKLANSLVVLYQQLIKGNQKSSS